MTFRSWQDACDTMTGSLEASSSRLTPPTLRTGRVDDADLNFLEEDTNLAGSAFNQLETTVNGNLLFNPSESLRTIDWYRWGSLLPFYKPADALPPGPIKVLYHEGSSSVSSFLGVVDGLLTAQEVDQIKSNEWKRQHFHYNRGDRVIVVDQDFSHLLWSRLETVLRGRQDYDDDNGLSAHVSTPLGFGVSGALWEIDGINTAMRINTYKGQESFEPHRDAQFCESRRRRSVLSLVIYLTDAAPSEGGETRFYASKAVDDLPSGPLTIREELQFYQNHSAECLEIDVKPVHGRCVLFTHDLIHQSLPMSRATGGSSERVILRTDVIASSHVEPRFTDREEVHDYRRALALFTEAEQLELKAANFRVQNVKEYDPVDESYYHGNQFLEYQDEVRLLNERCNDFYSKSLYLRYMYPRRLDHRSVDTGSDHKFWIGLPDLDILHVLDYLSVQEATKLTVMYPFLKASLAALETEIDKDAIEFSEQAHTELKELGKDNTTNRYYLDFSIHSKYAFNENVDAWCRVAAVLVAYKVSQASSSSELVYCARFLPQTGQVLAIPLQRLIYDAFFMRKTYGAVYGVRQQDPQDQNVQSDFEASVERGVILRDHGLEFVGQNISDHFHVHIEPGPTTVRRRLNCVDGMLGGIHCKHEMNVVSKSKRPGRHRFVQVDTGDQKVRYGVTHHANGSWILTQDDAAEYKKQHSMNHLIFDFERYKFNVTRQATWEGIEYVVEVSEMIEDIEPFYHAATYHQTAMRQGTIYRGGGSVKLDYLSNGGADSPFLDLSGAPSELRVKPTKRKNDIWDVRVSWNGSFFPVTL